jgi:hypothetical protein
LAPLAIAAPLQGQAQAQVIWEPVTEEQADQLQILVPAVDGGATSVPTSPSESNASPQSAAPQPIVWEVVPDPEASDPSTTKPSSPTEVVWEPLPNTPSIAADGSDNSPATAIVWEVLPEPIAPLAPEGTDTIAEVDSIAPTGDSAANASEEPPAEVIAQEEAMPPRVIPGPPPPPPLQALNRSIAFGDGLVGPDISLRIPNGFRWSQNYWGDATVIGYSYQEGRNPGDPFIPALASGNLDGWAVVHLNLLQTKHWSVALNTTFRSLQNNPNIPGGSTGIFDGVSNGFRISRSLGDTAGISFGGEQVLQWDDQSDRGRNLYLAISKGWWLGANGRNFPLLIANGGLGSGRLASFTRNHENNEMQDLFDFTCVPIESNRTVGRIDENLCWGPFASINFVANPSWGGFFEYATSRGTLGLSVNLSSGLPIRLTGAVHIIEKDQWQPFDQQLWTVQASIGF